MLEISSGKNVFHNTDLSTLDYALNGFGLYQGWKALPSLNVPRGMSGAGEVAGSARNVIPRGSSIQDFAYRGNNYKYVHDQRLVNGVAYTDARGIVHINPQLTTKAELSKVFDHEVVHVWLTPNRYSPSVTWRQGVNEWGYNSIDTIRFLEETAAHSHDSYVALRAAGHSRIGSGVKSIVQGIAETHGYKFIDGTRLVSYPIMVIEVSAGGFITYKLVDEANNLGKQLFGEK